MRTLAILALMGLCAACGRPERATSIVGSAVTAAPAVSIRGTAPAWRYALPTGWEIAQVRVGDTAVVIGARSEVRVLEPATGRLRWQRGGGATAMTLGETAAYYGATGTIAARALSDGRARWERRGVCPPATDGTSAGGVSLIVRDADELVVGCRGGRLVRIAAASGRIAAQSDSAFVAESVSEIARLGTCAYGVSGWSSGAALRAHAAIVDCKRLNVIVPEQDEMVIVGSIGDIAVLDERCCFGRPDVYRPATIVRANLETGALSPEVDLTPEPSLYPADHRPIGQGSVALLEGTELYLLVDRTFYRYGDARALSESPRRIAADLVDFPTFLRHGMLAVRLRVAGGAIDDEIVRIRKGTLEPLWSARESAPVNFSYDGEATAGVLTVRNSRPGGHTFVRIPDGAQLFVTDPCQMLGANRDLVLTVCTTETLVGNRYLQYLAAYRWRAAAPR